MGSIVEMAKDVWCNVSWYKVFRNLRHWRKQDTSDVTEAWSNILCPFHITLEAVWALQLTLEQPRTATTDMNMDMKTAKHVNFDNLKDAIWSLLKMLSDP